MKQVRRKAKTVKPLPKEDKGTPPFVRQPVQLPYQPVHTTLEAIRAAVEKLPA